MSSAASEGPGATSAFHCDTCKCSLKDSVAWFDHINGKRHNQLLGMSMVVEKVSIDRVKNKLALLAQKKKGVGAIGGMGLSQKRPKLEEFGAADADEEDDYQVSIQPSKR